MKLDSSNSSFTQDDPLRCDSYNWLSSHHFRSIIGDFPFVVAAKLTSDVVQEQSSVGDAGIVGSWLKEGHVNKGDINPEYVSEFMKAIVAVRQSWLLLKY